ncbi:MAG TPA: hypothetical protein VJM50_23760 [Pyrinomonadaceae bacterium]|nr:hypothetical protein [Pyrinomonadaceae bacterium]
MHKTTHAADGIYSSGEIGINSSAMMREVYFAAWLRVHGPLPVPFTWAAAYKVETQVGLAWELASLLMINNRITVGEHIEFVEKHENCAGKCERVDLLMGLLLDVAKREGLVVTI